MSTRFKNDKKAKNGRNFNKTRRAILTYTQFSENAFGQDGARGRPQG
jgi:hypothetical protein